MSLERPVLKSQVSVPTRYSLVVQSPAPVVNSRTPASPPAPHDEQAKNDLDTYMKNLKNRYLIAVEN